MVEVIFPIGGGTLPRFLVTKKKRKRARGARTRFHAEVNFLSPGVKTPYDTPKGMIHISQYKIVGR